MADQSYILGKNDFQDRLPTLWKSEKTTQIFPEETYKHFSARIDRLIFAEQERAWAVFDYPAFRIGVKFDEARQTATYLVEVIDGERRENDGET